MTTEQVTDLTRLRDWLTAEEARIRASLPHMRVAEAWQAMSGFATGLGEALRVVDGLIAGHGLPTTGGQSASGASR